MAFLRAVNTAEADAFSADFVQDFNDIAVDYLANPTISVSRDRRICEDI
jgi:hypothetical protein